MTKVSAIERRIREFFRAVPKGETGELRKALVSQYAFERKDAIERTIQVMTTGKDVSSLFPDIIKNLATPDIDQKKLVYLYLMNYAKTHPELCILAVNTFVQDTQDPNPLVRALAIRTMGCIRVDKMVDYIDVPLQRTLKDESPYVRKTAAICVAKLFDLNPTVCVEHGFLEKLQQLLDDSNPMVVANAVSALADIQDVSPSHVIFEITPQILKKLLAALNECTEWGRITILGALANYKATREEAEHLCERVVPQLQHANPAVVLAAIRCTIAHLPSLPEETIEQLKRKMASPLITLLATSPQLQYVALRNIRIILEQFPGLLNKELRVFYCRYNDPLYLKLEKVDIMVRLVNDSSAKQLIAELNEYCLEVDMEFVRRSVRALGQVAIKIESSVRGIVDTLLNLLDNKVAYLTQEVVIVMRDILRKYPEFQDAIPALCDSIEEMDEPESRAAIVYILGEFAEKIPPIKSLLAPFARSFLEEGTQVQLQIITACVKLYLKRPDEGKDIIHPLLQTATSQSDNADIRDRAFIYWRILSSDTSVAKDIVLASKPPIDSTIELLSKPLLNELIHELGTLASVYHKSPASFLGRGEYGSEAVQKMALEEQQQRAREDFKADNLLDLDGPNETETESELDVLADIFAKPSNSGSTLNTSSNDIISLFESVAPTPSTQASAAHDPLGFESLSLGQAGSSSSAFADLASLGDSKRPSGTEQPSSKNDLLDLF